MPCSYSSLRMTTHTFWTSISPSVPSSARQPVPASTHPYPYLSSICTLIRAFICLSVQLFVFIHILPIVLSFHSSRWTVLPSVHELIDLTYLREMNSSLDFVRRRGCADDPCCFHGTTASASSSQGTCPGCTWRECRTGTTVTLVHLNVLQNFTSLSLLSSQQQRGFHQLDETYSTTVIIKGVKGHSLSATQKRSVVAGNFIRTKTEQTSVHTSQQRLGKWLSTVTVQTVDEDVRRSITPQMAGHRGESNKIWQSHHCSRFPMRWIHWPTHPEWQE